MVVDNNDTEHLVQGRMYVFGGPLIKPGNAGFKAAYDAAHALAALGPLDHDGNPTSKHVVALPPGGYRLV